MQHYQAAGFSKMVSKLAAAPRKPSTPIGNKGLSWNPVGHFNLYETGLTGIYCSVS